MNSDEEKHSVAQCQTVLSCRAKRSEVFNYFPFSIQFVENKWNEKKVLVGELLF